MFNLTPQLTHFSCLCLKASRVSEAERDVEHLLESNIGT